MQYSNNFKKDAALGYAHEDSFARYLISEGYQNVRRTERGRAITSHDISIEFKGKRFTFEVKHDRYTSTNNRVAIEICSGGKPSGIFGTKSNYFVYSVCGKFIIFDTERLRRLCEDVINKSMFPIVSVGGSNNNQVILIDIDILKVLVSHKEVINNEAI